MGEKCRITKIYFVYLYLILIFSEGSYIFFKCCAAFLFPYLILPFLLYGRKYYFWMR